ncbi:PAS domain-containing sensor histidine kinase [Myxococcota bacterium]|nr:PAS domain-containing sensor histidine kinase [Myxococcota bacterium]MBU1899283.1 PAS domain-containing sensor histidine kinase [Myxococcota bacterium]
MNGSLSSGILICDQLGQISSYSDNIFELIGISEDKIIGKNIKDFILFSLDELRNETEKNHEFSIQKIYRRINVSLIDGHASDIDNITIVLFKESELNVNLDKINFDTGSLSIINRSMPAILHRFKNSLAGINTALELIIEEIDDNDNVNILNEILSEIKCMHLFLDGFSMGHKSFFCDSKLSVEFEILDILEILDYCKVIEGVNLRFISGYLEPININKSILRAILFNLITNSIDACSPGDNITITARMIANKSFILEVNDTGKGMSSEILNKCTQPFFTTKERGSGLGLSLCKQISIENNGTFKIKSELNQGTSVILTFPLSK